MAIGKPSIKNIGKRRPRAMRILGKSLDRIAKVIAAGTILSGYMYAPIIALLLGEIGNGITELYAEDDSDNSEDETRI